MESDKQQYFQILKPDQSFGEEQSDIRYFNSILVKEEKRALAHWELCDFPAGTIAHDSDSSSQVSVEIPFLQTAMRGEFASDTAVLVSWNCVLAEHQGSILAQF